MAPPPLKAGWSWICSSIGCYGWSCLRSWNRAGMCTYMAYLHLHGVCSVRSWRVYSVGCILTVASMDGGVTLSVMSSGKCICRTGFPIIPTPHSTPHPHTSYLHLIPTPHPHTSSPHLIPTPHPHTSSPHLIPTPHPHTSASSLIFSLFFILLP